MDSKVKEALIKYYKNFDEEFNSDFRMNVYVGKYFIAPYNNLDYFKMQLGDSVKDYMIYFVLSASRNEIISYIQNGNDVILTYKDYNDKNEKMLVFNLNERICMNKYFLEFIKPFFKYEIARGGSSFKVSIPQEKMRLIKECYPEHYCCFPDVSIKSGYFFMEFDINVLISDEKGKNGEPATYDLLYIGKSNATNVDYDIIDRLSCHKTIQMINRENNLYYRDKELVILLLSLKSEVYRNIRAPLLNIEIKNKKWEENSIFVDMKENQDVVELIEIMLINHFKPKYNHMYVDSVSIESKLYKKFKEHNLNPVEFELDLNNKNKGRFELRTNETVTHTRMRNIRCIKKDGHIDITYSDLDEILYDAL